jgi:hypothetical protein
MSDEMNSYAAALAAFQADLPKVSKASQGNRGRYADLADVSSTVLPLLAKQGLSWSARPTITEDGFVLRYTLRHVGGGFETGDYPLPSPTEPPQTLGSAITYSKRYALCAVTGVAPDNDDDDGAHATENHRATPPAQRRSSAPANGNSKPAEKTPAQVASAFVAQLMDVETQERAEVGMAAVNRSGVKDVDVSGLIKPDWRECLDIREGDKVVLSDLASLVLDYVGKHKRSVRASAVPA